jgi:hypothetical protein
MLCRVSREKPRAFVHKPSTAGQLGAALGAARNTRLGLMVKIRPGNLWGSDGPPELMELICRRVFRAIHHEDLDRLLPRLEFQA